jgi:FAD/FMN-containing dehydrogenase
VRGGAHSMSGAAVADGGLMIDLSQLSQVRVDPQAKRARAGGGALLAGLDAATQAHGLAVPAGLDLPRRPLLHDADTYRPLTAGARSGR